MYTEPCVSLASVTAAVYSLTGTPQNDKVNRAYAKPRGPLDLASRTVVAASSPSFVSRAPIPPNPTPLLPPPAPLVGNGHGSGDEPLPWSGFGSRGRWSIRSPFELEATSNSGFFCGDLWCDLMDAKAKPEKRSSNKESEVDQEPLVGEQGVYYYGYYYPGLAFYFSKLLIFSPQTLVSPGVLPQQAAYGPELVPAYPWDPSFFFTDEIQGSITVDPTNPHYKPNLTSHGHTRALSKTMPTSKSVLGTKGSSLASDVSHPITVQNQTHKPVKKGAAAVLSKGYVPINKFNVYANQGKGELLYSKSAINLKENGRSWVDDEKLKVKNKLNSHGDFDLLNEQNRGPRTNGSRSSSQSGVDVLEALGAEKNDSGSISSAIVNKDEYNRPDFRTQYEHASFFVIKSYSEDDIHKSIKYDVWASTPNGNKRLDNAFQVAQEKMAEKNSKCPVFLFFSFKS
ncbi:hypothetical protein BHE74_00022379 [Ensete ventricosum]|nr:hypothetical protein GW17_00000803 [Ensete ventricosum]RWW69982.1 hypothetical protein BHE74_00022379 [Ensete ventricosum]